MHFFFSKITHFIKTLLLCPMFNTTIDLLKKGNFNFDPIHEKFKKSYNMAMLTMTSKLAPLIGIKELTHPRVVSLTRISYEDLLDM